MSNYKKKGEVKGEDWLINKRQALTLRVAEYLQSTKIYYFIARNTKVLCFKAGYEELEVITLFPVQKPKLDYSDWRRTVETKLAWTVVYQTFKPELLNLGGSGHLERFLTQFS